MDLADWQKWWERGGENELRVLLMATWDPIGVSDAPEAWSEYDSYLGPLGRRLREGALVARVADYLSSVRPYGDDPASDEAAAEHVVEWYAASTWRFANPPRNSFED